MTFLRTTEDIENLAQKASKITPLNTKTGVADTESANNNSSSVGQPKLTMNGPKLIKGVSKVIETHSKTSDNIPKTTETCKKPVENDKISANAESECCDASKKMNRESVDVLLKGIFTLTYYFLSICR